MKKFLFLTIFAIIVFTPFIAKAGFGISPPYINNSYLNPGSHFETTITLTRSDPSKDIVIETDINASEIKNWIIIDNEFIIPKGEQQFPMKVGINVPKSAAYGDYQGSITIRVKTLPDGPTGLGARIDIKLKVIEGVVSDFVIKSVAIPYFYRGEPLVVSMILENKSNIKIKPSKVHIDIYDINHEKILKSGDITVLELVEPFTTKQISGQMQVDLEASGYWADITIYKDSLIVYTFKDHFSIIKEEIEIEPLVTGTEIEREFFFINLINFILSIIMR